MPLEHGLDHRGFRCHHPRPPFRAGVMNEDLSGVVDDQNGSVLRRITAPGNGFGPREIHRSVDHGLYPPLGVENGPGQRYDGGARGGNKAVIAGGKVPRFEQSLEEGCLDDVIVYPLCPGDAEHTSVRLDSAQLDTRGIALLQVRRKSRCMWSSHGPQRKGTVPGPRAAAGPGAWPLHELLRFHARSAAPLCEHP